MEFYSHERLSREKQRIQRIIKYFYYFSFLFILRVSYENYLYALLLIFKRIIFLKIMGCYCGPYPIHGLARLAIKWKENVKRKCGLIFKFWKIHPQGGTVLLWSRHLLLFLFLSGENKVRTKNPNDSSMEKNGLRKLDFWVRGSDYLSGR